MSSHGALQTSVLGDKQMVYNVSGQISAKGTIL